MTGKPVSLYTDSIEELYELLNNMDGELVIDLSVNTDKKYPYLRIYNDEIQYMVVKPLGSDSKDGHEMNTRMISEEEFEYLIQNSDVLRVKHRSETPFSREVQERVRDERKQSQ